MTSSIPTKAESLRGVVIMNPQIEEQCTPDGLVRLRYPAPLPRLLSRLLPKTGTLGQRTLELDTMGTFVWQHIDGERTVQQLAELVGRQYRCRPEEAELAVAQFIRQLGRRNILGVR